MQKRYAIHCSVVYFADRGVSEQFTTVLGGSTSNCIIYSGPSFVDPSVV